MMRRWQGKILLTAVAVVVMGAGPAWAYETGKVADGGVIKGKITYEGSIPTRKIVPTKDTEVCGGVHDVPLIVVAPDKGVKDVVVYLKEVKKGKEWPKPGKEPVLDNIKCKFVPYVQVVQVRKNITILNSDPVLHNTHGFLDNKTVFNVALPLKDMKIDKPLRKPGLVRVDCDAHGWMRGWIYVAENPYYSVTGDDGKFSIDGIPPGDYVLVVWQEVTGAKEQPVTVKAKETVTLNIELKK